MLRVVPRAALLSVVALPFAVPRAEEPADALERLVAEDWEARVAANPLFATSVDRDEGRDRLPDVSPEALARRAADDAKRLERLRAIDADALDRDGRVTHAMLVRDIAERVDAFRFGEWMIPLNADSGFHSSFARLADTTELKSAGDVRAYLARLRAFPGYVEQHIENMRAGLESGMTPPRVTLIGIDATVAPYVGDDVDSNPFQRALLDLPDSIDGEVRAELIEEGRAAVRDAIIPGYREFARFLREEYIPGARTTLGASEMPDGDAYYAALVKQFTTLDLTPKEVHERGVSEVSRIRAEMEALVEELEFEGSFAEFLAFLRTDERFYARTPDELLGAAARICKDVDGMLPRYFGALPRQPYGVEPVPASIAPKYTSGRYVGAPPDSTRAGTYWVNTYDLASRPLYALPALSLHEAVPGHHLQIALTAEMDHLPPFRRNGYISAFGEGWALYCEWLGVEMGVYGTPYEEFGRMTYEMWRASRLVVDTGIHAFGWSRERAIEFLASNTALSLHECTTEVDRYISWPGQALSYKTGEILIRELRMDAERELGERFDLRAFHDAVLENGAVPLDVLRTHVRTWIAESKRGADADESSAPR
ncbi:MAG: DUF885 domain-containing protein [Planctomycetota bacterium]